MVEVVAIDSDHLNRDLRSLSNVLHLVLFSIVDTSIYTASFISNAMLIITLGKMLILQLVCFLKMKVF